MNTQMSILFAFLAVSSALLVRLYIRRRSSFLRKLRAPESHTFLLGSYGDLIYQNEVGDCEFKWMRQYGSVWRSSGSFGQDHLMVADPKALQYILHTSGYNFVKRPPVVKIMELMFGKGIIWAHGETHQRQRKVMTPAFFAPQLKTFLSLFQNTASKLVQIWKEELITTGPSDESIVNVAPWLSRTTLDVIGEVGFGFQFDSLYNVKTPLRDQMENFFVDSVLYPPRWDMLFKSIWRYIPGPLLDLVRYLPTRQYKRFRRFLKFMRKFSEDMIEKSMIKGDGKDIMSVLLRANASENPKSRLTGNEVVDQTATLLFAGHDTTANSLTWYLWEIAKHPESQERIRAEIAAIRAKKGGEELSASDLDGMTFTQATLKEAMRLHPIVYFLPREAGRDEVIPLAFPITTESGEQISSIPVRKGTPIDIAIGVYNRLPGVWGLDADDWNPERFLNFDKSNQTPLGVFANLRLNFCECFCCFLFTSPS
ncbi:cytochrome P450 [Multifurca ochricompacta]|uniref:Cytochrome P450 n=1 Tax=Multifurca ochricompacta TaxID=376703 RepID=A0AAD4M9W4_9AGAM|nr:cytochrome P450 [Multifurca ochricompacta]